MKTDKLNADNNMRDRSNPPKDRHGWFSSTTYSWSSCDDKWVASTNPHPFEIFLTAVLAIFALITILNTVTIVPSGYTGVVSTMGIIDQSRTLSSGTILLHAPYFQSVKKVNNKVQKVSFADQIWGESSERTAVYYKDVTVSYQILPEESAWICANVLNYDTSIVTQAVVTSACKRASRQVEDLDSTNRNIMEPLITRCLQDVLTETYGKSIVAVTNVAIGDADFEQSYQEAIAAKQTAKLNLETIETNNKIEIEKAKKDAEIKVISAEAEASEKKAKAEGEAEAELVKAEANAKAIKLEADAQAEANKKIADSLTTELLQQQYYETWDGALPKITVGEDSTATPILNIPESAIE